MFRLERPEFLWILLLIPAFLWINSLLTIQKKRRISMFGNLEILSGFDKVHMGISFKKRLLTCIAILCISIAMTNPQFGSNKHTVNSTSSDIFILFDVSRSMTADDIKPSRLEKAQNFATNLIEELKSNRIGLVIFAGRAYLQMPLTDDYSAAITFIGTSQPDMVPTQGTAIGSSIELALSQFDLQSQTNKSIIILSDGEDQDEGALDAAKLAEKKGIQIYTVGVGTEAGGFMTVHNSGRADFKRDESGNPIRTKLNQNALIDIAKTGNGNYYDVRSGEDAIQSLSKSIASGAKNDGKTRSYYDYESYFQWFLFLALLALFFAWYDFTKVKFTPLRKAYLILCLIFLSGLINKLNAQELMSEARKADELYKTGKFDEAESKYDIVANKNPKESKYIYNKGNAQYKQKKYKEALDSYNKIIEHSTDNQLKNKTLFNIGNAHYDQKEYVNAIQSYIEALKINPYDMDTKKNLSLAFKKFGEEQQKKKQQEQENQDKNKKQDKQD
ncbi:MAG TPA: VWA domain-containing protein, partial [Saprospiraceae bacterium]|nr:VWA domain-containing protein [Saprospiraceae bacterium]